MANFDRLRESELAEAVALARASLGNGGQHSFLAKALLQALGLCEGGFAAEDATGPTRHSDMSDAEWAATHGARRALIEQLGRAWERFTNEQRDLFTRMQAGGADAIGLARSLDPATVNCTLTSERVNEIWQALENGKQALFRVSGYRTSGEVVRFIVDEAMGETFTREEVLEAWLYQMLTQIGEARGVPQRPKRTAS